MTLLGEKLAEGIDPNDLAPGEVAELNVRHLKTESGHRYEKRSVLVGDEADSMDKERLNLVLDMWDRFIQEHEDEFPIPHKKNGFQKNPAYEWFYNAEDPEFDGTMREWLELVPSAKALYAMQMLDDMERVFASGVVTERSRDILRNSLDAVAIRARAGIMKEIIKKSVANSPGETVELVSLGAGAAVPATNAALEIQAELGKRTNLHLYDQDAEIMRFAEESTARAGIPSEQVRTYTGDYYDAFQRPPESADVIEALGLFEYLHTSRCERLIEEAYAQLKPGGVLVFSNMLEDRDQLTFNQRGVAWPGVKPRSIDNLVDMVAAAHIDTDSVVVTISEDGVYAVVEVHKP